VGGFNGFSGFNTLRVTGFLVAIARLRRKFLLTLMIRLEKYINTERKADYSKN